MLRRPVEPAAVFCPSCNVLLLGRATRSCAKAACQISIAENSYLTRSCTTHQVVITKSSSRRQAGVPRRGHSTFPRRTTNLHSGMGSIEYMCWSGEASVILATVGISATVYIAKKGDSKELWNCGTAGSETGASCPAQRFVSCQLWRRAPPLLCSTTLQVDQADL